MSLHNYATSYEMLRNITVAMLTSLEEGHHKNPRVGSIHAELYGSRPFDLRVTMGIDIHKQTWYYPFPRRMELSGASY